MMKHKFLTFFTLANSLLISSCLNAQSYSDGYFKVLDYFVACPFDFLGKTEFELSGFQQPPEGMPVSKGYWSISLQQVPGGGADYDSYFKITTGYSPVYVLMGKSSRISFGLSFSGSNSLGITFHDLKNHLEQDRGVIFDKNGFSQTFNDKYGRGSFYVGLSLLEDIPLVSIFAVKE